MNLNQILISTENSDLTLDTKIIILGFNVKRNY